MKEKILEILNNKLNYEATAILEENIDDLANELDELFVSNRLEKLVKPANADFNLIAGMYAVLQCQLSCIWNKISGKEKLANSDAEKLIPKIEMLNEEIEKRLSV